MSNKNGSSLRQKYKKVVVVGSIVVLLLLGGLWAREDQRLRNLTFFWTDDVTYPAWWYVPMTEEQLATFTTFDNADELLKELGASSWNTKEEGTDDLGAALPVCENKLVAITVVDMDTVVKNCTEKKKEWREVTELGWASTDFWLYNWQLTVPEQRQGKDYKPVCYNLDKDTQEKYTMYAVPKKNDEWTDTIQWYDALRNIIDKWVLSAVVYDMYPDRMFCGDDPKNPDNIDPDCEDMKEAEARTDWTNYFVAGYREDGAASPRMNRLYVINGKVYSPWKWNINNHEQHEIWQWIWQFVTVKGSNIIVKRMKDEKHYPWKDAESAINPSTYTLQTCEIPL